MCLGLKTWLNFTDQNVFGPGFIAKFLVLVQRNDVPTRGANLRKPGGTQLGSDAQATRPIRTSSRCRRLPTSFFGTGALCLRAAFSCTRTVCLRLAVAPRWHVHTARSRRAFSRTPFCARTHKSLVLPPPIFVNSRMAHVACVVSLHRLCTYVDIFFLCCWLCLQQRDSSCRT